MTRPSPRGCGTVRRMFSRRTFHRLLGAGACAAACSPGGRRLSLYNWSDYLAPEVLRRAAVHLGMRVTQATYLAEAELLATMRSGVAHDLVFPIDYILPGMREQALIVPLARGQLPGLANLDPKFFPWSGADGQIYAVPYLWGTTGIGYDSDRVEAPTSWRALFDAQYAGRSSVLDSKGDVFDQALLAAGLNININSHDSAVLRERVSPMLQAQKQHLRAYDSEPARALVSGETWIAQIDSGDLLRAQRERPSLRYVIPDEGAVRWVDYLAMPAIAPMPGVAMRFIEFMLDPEIAALNANELRFATPNLAALTRGLITDSDNPALYPPPEVREKLQVSEPWTGATEALVDALWHELRGA